LINQLVENPLLLGFFLILSLAPANASGAFCYCIKKLAARLQSAKPKAAEIEARLHFEPTRGCNLKTIFWEIFARAAMSGAV
jgi:hypothetical protein